MINLVPVRVLQVVTIMNRGGLETMLMNYFRQIDRGQIMFDFMVHRAQEGHYDEEIQNLGGKIYRMPQIHPGGYSDYFRRLDRFFAEHREYRVVHSHINENSSFVLRSAKRAGVPCRIAHSHLSDLGVDLKLPFRWYARRCMKDYPTQYFACSQDAGKWLFGKSLAGTKQLNLLNNAVNIEDYAYQAETRKKARRELGVEDCLVLGHVGRFTKQKNHHFLLDVFKVVHHANPNSVLLLAGEGNLKQAIEQKAAKLGLQAAVKFLGVRNNIPELMQAFDLFVFPSLFEGLPVVLIEAQAAGLKCIVSAAITADADITGRVEFVSLRKSPVVWAKRILASSFRHEDTSAILRSRGYDASVMAKWLADYYMDHAMDQSLDRQLDHPLGRPLDRPLEVPL